MKTKITAIRNFINRRDGAIVALLATLMSFAYTTYYYLHGQILAYGDAESHINIAKRVTSSITPGFGQLGGNWLPLHHILMLPFVWNDWMWRTGLGGSIISMAAFVIAAYYLYRLTVITTRSRAAAFIAFAILTFNPNVGYMQSTPMSELPLIAAMIAGVYFLARWAQDENMLWLVLSGIWAMAGVLIRYDAWFSIIIEAILIFIICLVKRWKWSRIEGSVLLFSLPAGLGVALWLGWNELIFHDPFYFTTSAYSAHAQQQAFLARGQLFDNHHLWTSVLSYYHAVIDVAGIWIVFTATAGVIWAIIKIIRRRSSTDDIATSLLLAPIPFNIITLYAGVSILFVPEAVPPNFAYSLFNVRYGLMAVPALALLCGYFYAQLAPYARRFFAIVTPIQLGLFIFAATPITLQDGLIGLSARNPSEVPNPANLYIAEHYTGGYVAFDDFSRVANPISINVPMNKIIYVGNHPYWQQIQSDPASMITWLIIRRNDTDSLWASLKTNPELTKDYTIVATDNQTAIYKRNATLAVK
jgi:hypothetical protein